MYICVTGDDDEEEALLSDSYGFIILINGRTETYWILTENNKNLYITINGF